LVFDQKVRAVAGFRNLQQAAPLAAANKRVSNLLSKQDAIDTPNQLSEALFEEEAEIALYSSITNLETQLQPLLKDKAYSAYLEKLAQLDGPVDKFFTDVMVMCDDLAVRRNRLALLTSLQHLFLEVADISHLHSSKA
jgi:glycyl-tRNA synthetase beta chain